MIRKISKLNEIEGIVIINNIILRILQIYASVERHEKKECTLCERHIGHGISGSAGANHSRRKLDEAKSQTNKFCCSLEL